MASRRRKRQRGRRGKRTSNRKTSVKSQDAVSAQKVQEGNVAESKNVEVKGMDLDKEDKRAEKRAEVRIRWTKINGDAVNSVVSISDISNNNSKENLVSEEQGNRNVNGKNVNESGEPTTEMSNETEVEHILSQNNDPMCTKHCSTQAKDSSGEKAMETSLKIVHSKGVDNKSVLEKILNGRNEQPLLDLKHAKYTVIKVRYNSAAKSEGTFAEGSNAEPSKDKESKEETKKSNVKESNGKKQKQETEESNGKILKDCKGKQEVEEGTSSKEEKEMQSKKKNSKKQKRETTEAKTKISKDYKAEQEVEKETGFEEEQEIKDKKKKKKQNRKTEEVDGKISKDCKAEEEEAQATSSKEEKKRKAAKKNRKKQKPETEEVDAKTLKDFKAEHEVEEETGSKEEKQNKAKKKNSKKKTRKTEEAHARISKDSKAQQEVEKEPSSEQEEEAKAKKKKKKQNRKTEEADAKISKDCKAEQDVEQKTGCEENINENKKERGGRKKKSKKSTIIASSKESTTGSQGKHDLEPQKKLKQGMNTSELQNENLSNIKLDMCDKKGNPISRNMGEKEEELKQMNDTSELKEENGNNTKSKILDKKGNPISRNMSEKEEDAGKSLQEERNDTTHYLTSIRNDQDSDLHPLTERGSDDNIENVSEYFTHTSKEKNDEVPNTPHTESDMVCDVIKTSGEILSQEYLTTQILVHDNTNVFTPVVKNEDGNCDNYFTITQNSGEKNELKDNDPKNSEKNVTQVDDEAREVSEDGNTNITGNENAENTSHLNLEEGHSSHATSSNKNQENNYSNVENSKNKLADEFNGSFAAEGHLSNATKKNPRWYIGKWIEHQKKFTKDGKKDTTNVIDEAVVSNQPDVVQCSTVGNKSIADHNESSNDVCISKNTKSMSSSSLNERSKGVSENQSVLSTDTESQQNKMESGIQNREGQGEIKDDCEFDNDSGDNKTSNEMSTDSCKPIKEAPNSGDVSCKEDGKHKFEEGGEENGEGEEEGERSEYLEDEDPAIYRSRNEDQSSDSESTEIRSYQTDDELLDRDGNSRSRSPRSFYNDYDSYNANFGQYGEQQVYYPDGPPHNCSRYDSCHHWQPQYINGMYYVPVPYNGGCQLVPMADLWFNAYNPFYPIHVHYDGQTNRFYMVENCFTGFPAPQYGTGYINAYNNTMGSTWQNMFQQHYQAPMYPFYNGNGYYPFNAANNYGYEPPTYNDHQYPCAGNVTSNDAEEFRQHHSDFGEESSESSEDEGDDGDETPGTASESGGLSTEILSEQDQNSTNAQNESHSIMTHTDFENEEVQVQDGNKTMEPKNQNLCKKRNGRNVQKAEYALRELCVELALKNNNACSKEKSKKKKMALLKLIKKSKNVDSIQFCSKMNKILKYL